MILLPYPSNSKQVATYYFVSSDVTIIWNSAPFPDLGDYCGGVVVAFTCGDIAG